MEAAYHPHYRYHLDAPLVEIGGYAEGGSSLPPPLEAAHPPHNGVTSSTLHQSRSSTLRSRFLNPCKLWWRNARVSPAFLVAMCLVSAFCGSWVQMATDSLPTPGGPAVTTVGRTGRRALALSDSGGVGIIEPTAIITKSSLTNPLGNEAFEDWAFNASGFSTFRPALTPGESGDPSMRIIPFQTISWFPRITYYPGFVDKERAEHIISVAKRHLSPSALAYRPGDSIPEAQNVRTSTGTFLSANMDKDGVLGWVEEKIASVTHIPVGNGEPFNVLRYMPTQHYDSHYDTFDPKEFGKQYSTRIATFLLFLSDVEEGGETVFKREGAKNGNLTIDDWRTCADSLGIKVKPKQGDAVLFWSAHPDLNLDKHALHGACPVVKGEKWSMAKWMREH